jgi:hypothetical protein
MLMYCLPPHNPFEEDKLNIVNLCLKIIDAVPATFAYAYFITLGQKMFRFSRNKF